MTPFLTKFLNQRNKYNLLTAKEFKHTRTDKKWDFFGKMYVTDWFQF